MTAPRRRVGATARVLALLVAVAGLVLAAAGPAAAHAALLGATPADGSTTTTAPATVVLRFDENVRAPSVVVVTGPDGRVDHGPTSVVDATASVRVAMSGPGRYTVAYRVVSADGHPVSGRTTFRYRGPRVAAARPGVSPAVTSGGSGATADVVGVLLVALVVGVLALLRRRRTAAQDAGAAAAGGAGDTGGTGPRTAGPGDHAAPHSGSRDQP